MTSLGEFFNPTPALRLKPFFLAVEIDPYESLAG